MGKRPVSGRSRGVAGGALPHLPRPDLLGPLGSRFWALADEVSDAEEQGDDEFAVGSAAAKLSSPPDLLQRSGRWRISWARSGVWFRRQGAGELVVALAGGRRGFRPAERQRPFLAKRARRIFAIPSPGLSWTSRCCITRRFRFARLRCPKCWLVWSRSCCRFPRRPRRRAHQWRGVLPRVLGLGTRATWLSLSLAFRWGWWSHLVSARLPHLRFQPGLFVGRPKLLSWGMFLGLAHVTPCVISGCGGRWEP
jgi:hypothetical protein